MADILSISDFDTGKSKVNYNTYQETDFEAYIDRYEKQYLIELLGVTEYGNFIADLSGGVPVTAKFLTLFNPLAVELNDMNIVTDGMKEMLKGFVYFHWVRDNMTSQTTVGSKQTQSENADNISATSALIQSRFNDSVDAFLSIQYYIEQNDSDYEDYNGKQIGYSLPI